MTTTPQQIDALLTVRSETERLEFKAAENNFHFEELVDYCVALANEGGGRVVLGVTDKIPRRVVGTKAFAVPERTVAGLHERLHLKVTFDEVAHPDGRVLVFHVPSRPVGQPVHYKGRYLMRAGEELVPMSADQLKRIMAEGEPSWLSQPAMIDCDDDKIVQLLDTQSYFDLLQLPYPVNRAGVLERFESEKLIVRDGVGWTITNLGGILFAKKLEQFDRLARKAPRVIVYEGTNKLKTKLDKPGSKGYAVGFQGLVEFINGLVPSNEVIEQALRREVKMFPEIAVRELVANALIHQDFTETGVSVMIEIYDDRMEITNPGKPFISPDRFIDEYQSRNERLADLMRRLGICEEKGSGIDKVVHWAEAYQLPAPDFRVGERRTSALLFAHIDFEAMDRSDRIRACYQHCCLRYVMNEKMTNQSLRERFKLKEDKVATVSQIIAATVEAGKIKAAAPAQTSTRYRNYVPFWA
ncbi:MAG: putative DNA binding domain-containing protein [Planctomycetota bacterium]|nr:putative DNA binding domain-containing protein [Planctomycetota bacterium]